MNKHTFSIAGKFGKDNETLEEVKERTKQQAKGKAWWKFWGSEE